MTILEKIKCALGLHHLGVNLGLLFDAEKRGINMKKTKFPFKCKRCWKTVMRNVAWKNLNEKVSLKDEQGEI